MLSYPFMLCTSLLRMFLYSILSITQFQQTPEHAFCIKVYSNYSPTLTSSFSPSHQRTVTSV